MSKVQVFYDYACPFCREGLKLFEELVKTRTDLEIEWIPTEAHPRPENVHPHSDRCSEAWYVAKELGVDPWAFHDAMYKGYFDDRRNVEFVDEVAACVKGLADPVKFKEILESGAYAAKPGENNDLAYEKSGVWVLPAFRMDGKKLDATGGVGVSSAQIRAFLG
ncbi:MAG: DsbA family protein [Fusobacteriaceae bacterium]|jgi:predicted DsbA family dithiol-disulfide isomerase|nr:DsbA family protein [Fusobacteriaceae bacterium]